MPFSDALFPFRFSFDRRLMITDIGKSLSKLAEGFRVGAYVHDLVSLKSEGEPITGRRVGFEGLRSLADNTVNVVIRSNQTTMRCQLLPQDDDTIMVVGSPVFSSTDEMKNAGLDAADFAIHDATVSELSRRDAQNAVLGEHPLLVQMSEESRERYEIACIQHSLAFGLNVAGGMLLRLDARNRILEARSSSTVALKARPDQLLAQDVFEVCPELASPLRDALARRETSTGPIEFQYELRHDDEWHYFDGRVVPALDGETLVLVRDVTEQARLKLQLEHQATHDPLTDLPNRSLFADLVGRALASESVVAVLFIDLDDFKLINDRHGHHMGDEALRHVSSTINRVCGPGYSGARLGGDEFAVLLTGLRSKQEAADLAQQMIDELMVPIRIGHRELSVSVSIGIATTFDAKDQTTLFQFADIAMYQAKAMAKCCYQIFEPSMYESMLRRDTMHRQLLSAGSQQQFVNHYQPIVEIASGKLVGIETLVRWDHPIRGLLLPDEFIQLAEQSDAIVALGEQTLNNACCDAKSRDQDGVVPWDVHINVSSMQLRKSCLVSLVQHCLDQYGLQPDRLVVEVKEETFQADFRVARDEIARLHEMGVKIALDEFGAGNYSLAFLEKLPVQKVKLARSFVKQLGESDVKNELVRAVVQLALALGQEVIPVGVETLVQEELLRGFGCKLAQGDFYASPVPNAELLRIADVKPTGSDLQPTDSLHP